MKSYVLLFLSVTFVAPAFSMLTVVRQLPTKSHSYTQRSVSNKNKKDVDFYKQVQKIGLSECMTAYQYNQACQNPLCCKHAFTSAKTMGVQQTAQAIREQFLYRVDKSDGRVKVAVDAAESYRKLCRIEKRIVLSTGYTVHPHGNLLLLIEQLKRCLMNQFRVIKEDSPVVERNTSICFTIKNGKPCAIQYQNYIVSCKNETTE